MVLKCVNRLVEDLHQLFQMGFLQQTQLAKLNMVANTTPLLVYKNVHDLIVDSGHAGYATTNKNMTTVQIPK